jgi:hypothetical protein
MRLGHHEPTRLAVHDRWDEIRPGSAKSAFLSPLPGTIRICQRMECVVKKKAWPTLPILRFDFAESEYESDTFRSVAAAMPIQLQSHLVLQEPSEILRQLLVFLDRGSGISQSMSGTIGS